VSENPFIRYITEGRIRNREELRHLYRRLALETHPDAVGSDRLSHKFIEFHADYEEARRYLDQGVAGSPESGSSPEPDPRLEFYESLHILERVDTPFNFSRHKDLTRIQRLKEETRRWFDRWHPDLGELYAKASAQYDQLKRERPAGPYRKDDLYCNVYPFFHNITCYHVMGNRFYSQQMKRNLSAVRARLDDRQMDALQSLLLMLIADADHGPACRQGRS
jgi:hypothetical protein